MAVPLAHAIAGTHTDFAFTLSLSVSATLAASTAHAGAGAIVQTRRVGHYKSRTRELETKLGYASKNRSGGGGQTNEQVGGADIPESQQTSPEGQ